MIYSTVTTHDIPIEVTTWTENGIRPDFIYQSDACIKCHCIVHEYCWYVLLTLDWTDVCDKYIYTKCTVLFLFVIIIFPSDFLCLLLFTNEYDKHFRWGLVRLDNDFYIIYMCM